MKADSKSLMELIDQWKHWSVDADKSEDGWQACFPDWERLVSEASLIMKSQEIDEDAVQLVEFCWQISEEDEDLLDLAKEDIDSCWPILVKLCSSSLPSVRWQVYEAFGVSGSRGEPYLRSALGDEDSYCLRRAMLALANVGPSDSSLIAERFLKNPDPYIRKAAEALSGSGKQ